MADNFVRFLAWEAATRDVIDFKKLYVDMAGDVIAGLMLSEIIYWHLPTKEGTSKLVVEFDDRQWLAVRRYDWWERCRLSPRQADTGLTKLVNAGLIEKTVRKFGGEPTTHVHLLRGVFLAKWSELISHPLTNPFLQIRENEITKTDKTKLQKRKNHIQRLLTKTTSSSPSNGSGKRKRVPEAQMTPMKSAIADEFGWLWPAKDGEPPVEGCMTEEEVGQVQKAARSLCLAGYGPEVVPDIYKYCEQNFTQFSPLALAGKARAALKDAKTRRPVLDTEL